MKKILSLILAAAFAVATASAAPSFAGGGPLCERGAEALIEQGAKALGGGPLCEREAEALIEQGAKALGGGPLCERGAEALIEQGAKALGGEPLCERGAEALIEQGAKALGGGPLCERGAEALIEQGAKALGGAPLARPGSEEEDLIKARPMVAEKPDTCEVFGSEEAMCEQEPQEDELFKVEDYLLAYQCEYEHQMACWAESSIWSSIRLEMVKKGVSRFHVFLSIKENDYTIETISFDAWGDEVKGRGMTIKDVSPPSLLALIIKTQQALKSSEFKSVNYGFVYRGDVSSAEAILRFHKRDKSSFFVKTSGKSFIQGFEEIFKRTVKAYKA